MLTANRVHGPEPFLSWTPHWATLSPSLLQAACRAWVRVARLLPTHREGPAVRQEVALWALPLTTSVPRF